MRHLRSILYALVLTPAVWILCGVGFDQDLTGRARDNGGIESLSGVLLLLLAGAAYAILLFSPISPLGPLLAGLTFLGIGAWARIAPASYAGVWPENVASDGFNLSTPGYGLAVLLAVPLLATALSARRWRGFEPPEILFVGTIGRARGAAAVAGTPMASERTAVIPQQRQGSGFVPGFGGPSADATQVIGQGQPTVGRPTVTSPGGSRPAEGQAADEDEKTTVMRLGPQPVREEPTQIVAPATEEPTHIVAPAAEEPTQIAASAGEEATQAVAPAGKEATDAVTAVEDEPTQAVDPAREEPTQTVTAVEDEPTLAVDPAREEPTQTVTAVEDEPTLAVDPAREEPTLAADPAGEEPTQAVDQGGEEPTRAVHPVGEEATADVAAGERATAAVSASADPTSDIPAPEPRSPGEETTRDVTAGEAAEDRTTRLTFPAVTTPASDDGEKTQLLTLPKAAGPAPHPIDRGERTQVIRTGTVEPPGDRTQLLSFPAPPEPVTVATPVASPSEQTRENSSIVAAERPDPGEDPTTRLTPLVKPPGEATTRANVDRPAKTVTSLERPADEAADDTRPLTLPAQRPPTADDATPRR